MSSSYWYLPLEQCHSLDEIGAHWHALLEAHCSAPTWPEPRYRDAVLQFAGMSALPPRLKLGALLAWGSAFDVDLRLALGALLDAAVEDGLAWPDAVAAAVSDNGPALEVETADPWLGAFVAGRLAGLRETFVHDGLRPESCSMGRAGSRRISGPRFRRRAGGPCPSTADASRGTPGRR